MSQQDFIQDFLDFCGSVGIYPERPSEIIMGKWPGRFNIKGDKPNRKNGRYGLNCSEYGAWGWVIDSKDGVSHKFSTNIKRILLPDERLAWAKQKRDAEIAIAKAQEAAHADAAKVARATWDKAKNDTGHVYAERKGISKIKGGRVDGKQLLIPLYDSGEIVNLQIIEENGFKRFLKGGKVKGCFGIIHSTKNPFNKIFITEGWATGWSVWRAYNTESPVILAFNAGNMTDVARAVRAKYPQAQIIIAGDNDQWNERNIGLEKAREAAKAVGGVAAIPDFPHNGEKLTDWNDVMKTRGLEAVRAEIDGQLISLDDARDDTPVSLGAVKTGNESPEFSSDKIQNLLQWKKFPEFDGGGRLLKEGKLKPNNLTNCLIFLRHHREFMGIFREDRFSREIIIHRCPDWELDKDNFKVRRMVDTDILYVASMLEGFGVDAGVTRVQEAIQVVASENWIDPPLEYFEGLVWDGVKRLDSWLKIYMGASLQDSRYVSEVGAKWLIGGVARIYKPGCKMDNMLVLEGGQGIRKSSALATLCNIGRHIRESYFCDTITFSQIHEKDTVQKLCGKLIVEFAELAKLGGREIEEVKAWMTNGIDEVRRPYGRVVEKFPRKFILAGSTNESNWAVDTTGNRRFWPVACGDIDVTGLAKVVEQLWAEAVYLFKSGEKWWFDRNDEVHAVAEDEQMSRVVRDLWHDRVERIAGDKEFITVDEIVDAMGFSLKDMDRRADARITGILRMMGFERQKIRRGEKTVRAWRNKKFQKKLVTDDIIGEEVVF